MNKKGFAISGMIYSIMLLFLALMLGILTTLAKQKIVLDRIKNDTSAKISNYYEYAITINNSEGGVITANKQSVKANETVVLTIMPNNGYVVESLKYNDIELKSGTTFTMPHNDVTIEVKWIKSTYEFSYTGNYQEFVAPMDGTYKMELWGAQGGSYSTTYQGGNGGYTAGTIKLKKDDKYYIFVGSQGGSNATVTNVGGYNGGGYSGNNGGGYSMGGGGATDIRFFSSTPSSSDLVWDSILGLNSRIMIAGAGGGNVSASGHTNIVGVGGNLTGGTGGGSYSAGIPYGGSQIAGGNGHSSLYVGLYGKSIQSNTAGWGGGGGSGYYGGANGYGKGGAGGSSYISGYTGCVAITSNADQTPKDGCTTGTTDITCSYHYSGLIFTETVMKSGAELMPTHNGTSTMTGNTGNGFAKITIQSNY